MSVGGDGLPFMRAYRKLTVKQALAAGLDLAEPIRSATEDTVLTRGS